MDTITNSENMNATTQTTDTLPATATPVVTPTAVPAPAATTMTQNTEADETNTTIQKRLKSWPLWLAIAALVIFCAKEFAGINISEPVNGLMNVLLPVLVGLGIINNPTDKVKW